MYEQRVGIWHFFKQQNEYDADKDEKGELIVDGNGYKITPENMVLLQKELSDLNDYEIEPVQLTLYFEDLSSLSLTPRAYSILIPYISE